MTLMTTGHRQLTPAGWTGNPWPQNNPPIQEHHVKIFHKMVGICGKYTIDCHEHRILEPPFITGMALGTDQLFAQAVLKVKQDGLRCRLIAAVPFRGQESKWTPRAKEIYSYILSQCDEVVYVCEPGYAPWKMQKRNEWMVDHSTGVLAVWSGQQSGGTFNCVQYAKSRELPVIRLHPQTLEIDQL